MFSFHVPIVVCFSDNQVEQLLFLEFLPRQTRPRIIQGTDSLAPPLLSLNPGIRSLGSKNKGSCVLEAEAEMIPNVFLIMDLSKKEGALT